MTAVTACTSSSTPPPPVLLASDQTLSFPIAQDLSDFDPALISSPADVDVLRNVFSGLYKFDRQLTEVPDLAVGSPVSADGLTYTYHLRHNATFSNGDPITADDFLYSWNRAVAKQGDYATLFQLVAGYDLVAAGKSTQMSGLVKVDDYTFTSTLTKKAGYWMTELGLWPFWVVDSKVIAASGEDTWFTQPQTLIGSGPFRMTARLPGQTLDFEPVAKWYGGATGAIKHVHIDVNSDVDAQVTKYEAGVYSLIGYARQGLSPTAAVRYASDPKLKAQLQVRPLGVTYLIGFNLKTGPFAGVDAGRAGRHAFTAAIDRTALAQAACSQGTTCVAATGGVISKGLQGYLGDGADSNVTFDAVAAKAEYQAWDPNGSKVKGLTYTYDTSPFNKAVCANLTAQWLKNLGVTVTCVEMDRNTFLDDRNSRCAYAAFRQSWSADYDHPQDWFDNLFVTDAGSSGSCYSNASFDSMVANADSTPLTQSLADYKAAGQLLIQQVVYGALVYGVEESVAQPYVQGVGGNALYDYSWTEARVLRH
jgi:oligopeptide transport system substrate-binding protein